VVALAVNSDHKAVVAFHESMRQMPKIHRQHVYRWHTPAQHAEILHHAANPIDLTNPRPTASSDPAVNAQAEFDHFYMVAMQLLNQYYPEQVITTTSLDPEYITPSIKAMLRRRNRRMRIGQVEEAEALSISIGQAIERRCQMQLSRYNGKTDAGSMLAAVRRLTGRPQSSAREEVVTAETMNEYYVRHGGGLLTHLWRACDPPVAGSCPGGLVSVIRRDFGIVFVHRLCSDNFLSG